VGSHGNSRVAAFTKRREKTMEIGDRFLKCEQ
jgi:hypothetical protein